MSPSQAGSFSRPAGTAYDSGICCSEDQLISNIFSHSVVAVNGIVLPVSLQDQACPLVPFLASLHVHFCGLRHDLPRMSICIPSTVEILCASGFTKCSLLSVVTFEAGTRLSRNEESNRVDCVSWSCPSEIMLMITFSLFPSTIPSLLALS
jgi:hypothetical protein